MTRVLLALGSIVLSVGMLGWALVKFYTGEDKDYIKYNAKHTFIGIDPGSGKKEDLTDY